MYEAGKGVHRSASEALRWYRMAADAGDEDAMRCLDVLDGLGRAGQRF